MSEKDMQSKLFFGDNERFADFVNGSLYGGEQVVFADELEELNTEQVDKLQTRRRDILKRCKKDETVYAFFGTELQSTVDMMMPVRVMEYDAMSYRKMMENESKLYPLVTFCLYTGEKEWNKATSLYEMMNLPEGLKGIVQDYAIKVIQAKNADLYITKKKKYESFLNCFKMYI